MAKMVSHTKHQLVMAYPYQAFCFDLPTEVTGRNDISIYVEYSDVDDNGNLLYTAWGQFEDDYLRFVLHLGNLAIAERNSETNVVQQIMSDLNDSKEFHQSLHRYVKWAESN